MSEPHIHDLTGPDMRCACGFVFRAGRFCFSIDIYDNQTKQQLVNDGFNCEDIGAVVSALEAIIERLS